MNARNKVIAGDYINSTIIQGGGGYLRLNHSSGSFALNKTSVSSYEVLDESKRKSATSAVGRAFLGATILGPAGLLAGLSARTKAIHTVAVEFKDGKRSLLEMDEKNYKSFITQNF